MKSTSSGGPEKVPDETASFSRRVFDVLKKGYERFLKIRGNPRQIALGFALGVFVGMQPIMGIQTVIAVFFATLFKWNKISSAVGVWISNPVTAPVLYGFTYFVGAKIMGLKKVFSFSGHFDFSYLYHLFTKTSEIIMALVLGGAIVGVPLAVLAYVFSFSAIQQYQKGIKPKLKAKKKAKKLQRKKKRK